MIFFICVYVTVAVITALVLTRWMVIEEDSSGMQEYALAGLTGIFVGWLWPMALALLATVGLAALLGWLASLGTRR